MDFSRDSIDDSTGVRVICSSYIKGVMHLGEVRVGRVSSINYETGMMRVTYTDKNRAVTREFPLLNYGGEYNMPEVGQSVAVAHLSNGSSRGVILGTVWNKNNLPEEGKKGVYRKDFSKTRGAAVQQYAEDTGTMVLKAPNVSIMGNRETEIEGAILSIGANIQILLDTPEVEITAGTVKWEEIEMEVLAGTLTAVMAGLNMEMKEDLFARSEGNVILETEGNADLTAQGNVSMSASGNVEMTAESSVSVTAAGDLILQDGIYSTSLSEIGRCLEALGQTLGKG